MGAWSFMKSIQDLPVERVCQLPLYFCLPSTRRGIECGSQEIFFALVDEGVENSESGLLVL